MRKWGGGRRGGKDRGRAKGRGW